MAILPQITEPIFAQSGRGIKMRNPTGLQTLESTKNSTHVHFLLIIGHYDDQFKLFTKDEYL